MVAYGISRHHKIQLKKTYFDVRDFQYNEYDEQGVKVNVQSMLDAQDDQLALYKFMLILDDQMIREDLV